MGLLDGYPFDFYGNQPTPAGGLLGMLLRNTPDLPMPQAGGGFPGQNLPPTDISAASVQPQQPPPQLQQPQSQNPLSGLLGGLGSLFSPSQANAGPMQQTPQGASPGLLDRLTAGATNLTTGGNPLAGLFNAIGGLATGQHTDPQGIMLQNQAATAKALYSGLLNTGRYTPEQAQGIALAASSNPSLATAILPQAFGSKYEKAVTTDAWGGQHINAFDPVTGKSFESGGAGGSGASPAGSTTMDAITGQIDQLRQAGASPEQMLQAIPQGFRPYIQGLLEGRALPASLGMKSGARQSIMNLAQAMGLDEGELHARQQFAKDFGNTKSGMGFQLMAGGKVLNHLENVVDNAIAMHNKDIPSGIAGYVTPPALISGINAVGNNPPDQRFIANQLATEADSFSKEKGKFLSGLSGGTEAERKKTAEAYDPNAPRSNLAGTAQGDLDLLKGQFSKMTSQRDNIIGPNSDSKKFQIVTPEMDTQMQRIQKKIDMLRAGQGGEAQPKEAAPKLPQVKTPADAAKLPKGTHFLDPNGVERIVP